MKSRKFDQVWKSLYDKICDKNDLDGNQYPLPPADYVAAAIDSPNMVAARQIAMNRTAQTIQAAGIETNAWNEVEISAEILGWLNWVTVANPLGDSPPDPPTRDLNHAQIMRDGGGAICAMFDALPEDDQYRIKNPLAPLMETFLLLDGNQKPPRQIHSDTKPTGIIPEGIIPSQPQTIPAQTKPNRDESELPGLIQREPQQAALLPVFQAPDSPPEPPALILADYMGMRQAVRGRGARLDKRLFIYSLLSMPRQSRQPRQQYEWRPTLRELRDMLWPIPESGKSSYKRSRHLPILDQALTAVHNVQVELPGFRWRPVVVRGTPTGDLDAAEVVIQIELPPGCERGPQIDRAALISAGTISDPAFDLELGLAFLWDQSQVKIRGVGWRRVYATTPEVLRDRDGHITDAAGALIMSDGKPTKNWSHPKAIQTGRHIRHPQADRVPVLTPNGRRALAYGSFTGNRDRGQLSRERSAVDGLLEGMEAAGRIVIERNQIDPNSGAHGWRILESWQFVDHPIARTV